MKWRVSSFLGCMLFSFFVIPAQIQTTFHRIFPQFPQPTYDIACAAGSTALASTTNPTNGHLKAYLCVDNLGNVSVVGSGGALDALISAQTISPLLPPYNGVVDLVTVSPVDLSGGGHTIVSAGLFTLALNGKVGFCQLANDSQDGIPFGTFTFVDASHMNSTATIARAFANQTCIFTTQTFNAAETAAEAALATCASDTTTGQQASLGPCVLQEPCGKVWFSTASGTSFFNGTAFTTSTKSPIVVNGCPDFGTYFGWDCDTARNLSALTANGGNPTIRISNIVIGNFGIGCIPTGGTLLNRLVPISGDWIHNVVCNDWQPSGGGGQGACISPTTDGTRWSCVYGINDTTPVMLFDRQVILDNSCGVSSQSVGSNPALIIQAQEDGDRIIGGTYSGCPGVDLFSNINPSTITISNVLAQANGGCAGVKVENQTSNLHVLWYGGRMGSLGNNVINSNVTGLQIGTGSPVFSAIGTQIDGSGTGFNVNNSGNFWDVGGNLFNRFVGTNFFTGNGNYLGYTKLTGTAYTNSTTTFSNVVGSTGQNFSWPAEANGHLSIACHFYYQAAATGGLNIEFTGPAGFTSLNYAINEPLSTSTINTQNASAYSTSLGAAVTTAATNFDAVVTLDLINGATAGTVQLLAKSSAAVALTIQPGSFCSSQAR